MSMEHWLNDTARGQKNNSEKQPVPVSHCHPKIPHGRVSTYTLIHFNSIQIQSLDLEYLKRVFVASTKHTSCKDIAGLSRQQFRST